MVVVLALLLVLSIAWMQSLQQSATSPNHTTLERIQSDGVVRVGLIPASNSFIPHLKDKPGIDYELAQLLADSLNVKITFHNVSERQGKRLLAQGKLDVLASPFTEVFDERTILAPAYGSTSLVLLKHRQKKKPASIDKLDWQKLVMLAGGREWQWFEQSEYFEDSDKPSLITHINRDQLLQLVHNKSFEYTILPSRLYHRARFYFPDVRQHLSLTKELPISWAIHKDSGTAFQEALQSFFEQVSDSGILARLNDKYYGHTSDLKYWDTIQYHERIKTILPGLKPYFKEAAKETDLSWQMLAAVGYQESHWDKDARSYTGVRGIMMLTEATASHLGVSDRTDIEQSISGGARYLQEMLNKIPERIAEPDRLWMAMAAYNIGYGHLEDARRLAQKQGDDPDHWQDVEKYLGLLSEKEWYSKTRLGKARGYEAIRYVQNIRRYYDILLWFDAMSRQKPAKKRHYANLFDSTVL